MTARETALMDMLIGEFRDFRQEYRDNQQATNARLLSLETSRTEQKALEKSRNERQTVLRAWIAIAVTVASIVSAVIVKFL